VPTIEYKADARRNMGQPFLCSPEVAQTLPRVARPVFDPGQVGANGLVGRF